MEDTSFQLPVTGYDVIVRIIKGYLHAGADKDAVSVSSVADTTAMKRPNISANNKFLLAMGIIERVGKGYKLSQDGLHLAKILDFYDDDTIEVREAWKNLVEKNEFLQRVTAAVKVRGSMDVEAFARHIALTSGAPNKRHYLTGARTVITILQLAGEVNEADDGTLTVAPSDSLTGLSEMGSTKQPLQNAAPTGVLVSKESKAVGKEYLPVPFTIMVHISPKTTDQEIDEMAQKIKRLMERLSDTLESIEIHQD